jgi:hypothetical protein
MVVVLHHGGSARLRGDTRYVAVINVPEVGSKYSRLEKKLEIVQVGSKEKAGIADCGKIFSF